MPRKVLISFLGTNVYFPVYYTWGENGRRTTTHRTSFIQEALATKLCINWNPDDCIMVFRTSDSNLRNWNDNGNQEVGLGTTLNQIGLQCQINPGDDDDYIIEVGFSETEIWQIFNCVFNKINPEDEIYFDVTHAFRTIPMFTTVLFNYARFLKHTNVKGVYYGAFETLGPIFQVRGLPEAEQENLTAPVVDLTNIVRLQEINTAASNFVNYGAMSAFSDILFDTGIDELDDAVREISIALKNLDFYIQTCRIEDIRCGEYMITLHDRIHEFCESPFTNEAQRTLISEIYEKLCGYGFIDYDDYSNVEAAIQWSIDHNMIQQAYTMAKEYLISLAYDKLEKQRLEDRLVDELIQRNEISVDQNGNIRNGQNVVYIISKTLAGIISAADHFNNTRWNNSPVANELMQDPYFSEISAPFRYISNCRNNLNHANGNDMNSFEDYRQEFNQCWEECLDIIIHG